MYQPFYLQYPMYGIWDEQQQCMKDYEYMRQMYPREIATMQDFVEDVCDRMEYDGSVMYEEYPDRVSMILLRNEIMERMRNEQSLMDEFAMQEFSQGEFLQQEFSQPEFANYPNKRLGEISHSADRMKGESWHDERIKFATQEATRQSWQQDSWVTKMIDVLLCNEFCRRRQRRRRYR